jgi:C-terminal binding protein
MAKIAITDFITDPDIEKEILGDLVSATVGPDTEVLLVWHEKIDSDYIGKLPELKAVQRYGVGFDTIDIDALGNHGIIVCNNPDYGTDEVSDTTVAMIVNIARGLTLYNEAARKYASTWQVNFNPRLKRNSETTVGIIGAGRIGGSVILKCNAMKFKVIFYDKYKERGYEKLLSAKRLESMEEVLENSDIVSLHVPLTRETEGMVDRSFTARIKPGSSLVNTARGGLFADLDIIYEAIKSGMLYQFATDVLPDEPPLSGRLIDSWRRSEEWLNGRVIINPHTAWYSNESIIEMRVRAARNALRLLNGQPPHNRII